MAIDRSFCRFATGRPAGNYYITWHMQARLAPMRFTADDDKPAAG